MDYLRNLIKKKKNNRIGVYTTQKINANEEILKLKGGILSKPNKYSIRINSSAHLDRSYDIDDEINHSCDANCYIDTNGLKLISTKEIFPGEEITINYCCTEEVLAEPFICDCKSSKCYKEIKGYRYLNYTQKQKIEKYVNPEMLDRFRIEVQL